MFSNIIQVKDFIRLIMMGINLFDHKENVKSLSMEDM